MLKYRLGSFLIIAIISLLGFLLWKTQDSKPFKLGLDLNGGSYLVYSADISKYKNNQDEEIDAAMSSLREVLQNRVNSLDAAAANVSTEIDRFGENGKDYRVIVELPGITDLDTAIKILGETPILEFKLANPNYSISNDFVIKGTTTDGEDIVINQPENSTDSGINTTDPFIETGLTGEFLQNATVQFSQGGSSSLAGTPLVALQFNKEGKDLFSEITGNNIGNVLAIFLDGQPISLPVVQTQITNGEAVITGSFTPQEAKDLAGRLNSGALPIPINLIRTESVGPVLGQEATSAGVMAGLYGFALVSLFMLIWYRLPGFVSVLALTAYAILSLSLFKFMPVVLTAGGIVGFVISIGMAVDANILIAERIKEEIRSGQTLYDAVRIGFKKAWASIRDANFSSLISAVVLFWFGTPLIKSFAVTFGFGVLISMLTAVTISKIFLLSLGGSEKKKWVRFLFGSGFFKA